MLLFRVPDLDPYLDADPTHFIKAYLEIIKIPYNEAKRRIHQLPTIFYLTLENKILYSQNFYCKGTGNALQYLYIYLLFRSCRIWFRTNNSGAGKSSKFTKLVYAKFQWLIIPLSSGSFTHYERRKVCFPWSSSGSPGCTGWQWPAGRVSSPPPGL